MGHVFALLNQKGGIGKTTAAFQISAGLKRRGYKVLAIDMDPQCNLTFSCGGDYRTKPSIYDIAFNNVKIADTIQRLDEMDLVPGSNGMSSLEASITREGREFFLKDALEPIKNTYDYIVIDSPPALGLITVSVMTAADSIVIPSALDLYSLQGIGQLVKTYNVIKKYCNHDLVIDGILITKDSNSLKRLFKKAADNAKIKVFENAISNSPIISYCVFKQQSVFKFAPKSLVAQQYDKFITELLQIHPVMENGNKLRRIERKINVTKHYDSQMINELKEILDDKNKEGRNM